MTKQTDWHNTATHLTALAAGPREDLIIADVLGRCTYTVVRPAHGARAQQHYTSGVIKVKQGTTQQVG